MLRSTVQSSYRAILLPQSGYIEMAPISHILRGLQLVRTPPSGTLLDFVFGAARQPDKTQAEVIKEGGNSGRYLVSTGKAAGAFRPAAVQYRSRSPSELHVI